MANVLVVGANQGIGYYLVERLLELGNTVTVLDIQIHAIEILKVHRQAFCIAMSISPKFLIACSTPLSMSERLLASAMTGWSAF